MLDLIWEVSEGAHWNGLLWWILWITVALSDMWHNHLRVCLGTKSSWLKKWLLIPYTSSIHVKSSMNIIDSIDDEIELTPEFVVENVFSVWSNSCHIVFDIKVLVHILSNYACTLRFWVSNIGLSEKELSVEVTNFNVIVISTVNHTFISTTNTHKSECFNQLTSKSTSTNHKKMGILELFLGLLSINLDLVVVSAVHWRSIDFSLRKGLVDIEM